MDYSCIFFPCVHASSYSLPFEGTAFSNLRHAHYLIIKLDIRCISLAHIGIIHTSTHEKLSNSLSCTKIMNHVVQLQSYILDIIPSRSYITLQFLTLFKEELPSLSHNIRTWHHKVHIKACMLCLVFLDVVRVVI